MSSPTQAQQLRAMMQARFDCAKNGLRWAERLSIVIGALALIQVFLPEAGAWIGGGVAVGLLIAQQYHAHRFRSSYGDAERIRRAFLVSNGLGKDVPESEMARLRLDLGNLQHDGTPYYTSDLPPGLERLLMLTWESAFWTDRLQRLIAMKLWKQAAASTVFPLVAVIVLAATNEDTVIKVVIAALALLVGLNPWGKWWGCRSSAAACERIGRDCEALLVNLDRRDDLHQVMTIVLDYAATTSSAYPPSDGLYEANREALTREWETIKSDVERRQKSGPAQSEPTSKIEKEGNAHGDNSE